MTNLFTTVALMKKLEIAVIDEGLNDLT